eukprot:1589311-Rhodomonas_salina.1
MSYVTARCRAQSGPGMRLLAFDFALSDSCDAMPGADIAHGSTGSAAASPKHPQVGTANYLQI